MFITMYVLVQYITTNIITHSYTSCCCRRAELREADKLLMETELDLAEAQREARGTIQQYDQAQQGLQVRRAAPYSSTTRRSRDSR